jgi:hypothetical protein
LPRRKRAPAFVKIPAAAAIVGAAVMFLYVPPFDLRVALPPAAEQAMLLTSVLSIVLPVGSVGSWCGGSAPMLKITDLYQLPPQAAKEANAHL